MKLATLACIFFACGAIFLLACGATTNTCPADLPKSCPANPPSYASDIAPLVAAECESCHSQNGGPALSTYAELSAQQSAVLDQVYDCRMPEAPNALTLQQRTDLLTWLVCNSPDN